MSDPVVILFRHASRQSVLNSAQIKHCSLVKSVTSG